MGTYDTPGGSPLHDPAADYCPSDEECELALLKEQNAQMLEALKDVRGWIDGLAQLDDDDALVEGAFKQLPILDAAIAAAEPEE